MRVGGALKDPPSELDYRASKLLTGLAPVALPETFDYVLNPVVLDQGQTLECVAFASTGARIDERTAKGKTVPPFDPDALYKPIAQPGGGAYPRDCCDLMLKKGMPIKGKVAGCFLKKTTSAFDPGYKLAAYYRIDKSFTDIMVKQIIYTYGTFIIACDWPDNWMDKFNVFPDPSAHSDGGHCVRVNGWDKTGYVITNSWGKLLWGNWGRATMPYEIFHSWVLPDADCWKIVDGSVAATSFTTATALNMTPVFS